MTPKKTIKLYTLSGLAASLEGNEKVGVDYLNKLVVKVRKGKDIPARWKGYNFIHIGAGKRSFWLVSTDPNINVEIEDAPEMRRSPREEDSPDTLDQELE